MSILFNEKEKKSKKEDAKRNEVGVSLDIRWVQYCEEDEKKMNEY